MNFEPVIGLEVHAQLKTKTKIFCSCSTLFGDPPNTHTCPVCLGLPGVLPVLNKKVVEYALKMALATHCRISSISRFARKNYFYPDLPKGYQISQYEDPIAQNGFIFIHAEGNKKRIGIHRIHIEEDAGKLTHDPYRPRSMIDFNRTGIPLIEIVSEPEIHTAQEASAYLKQLRSILRYLKICDGNMEEGSFRCDANISIRREGDQTLGTRTELKNLNSFKFVERALEFEINRQKKVIMEGGEIIQETRLYDPGKEMTLSMRDKEEAHDYRYFPDPDLLPLVINDDWIKQITISLPELPEEKKDRFISEHKLPPYDADILTSSREIADYFEECLKWFPHPKPVSNWIMGPLMGLLNATGKTAENSPVSPREMAGLLHLTEEGTISAKTAKDVFDEMAQTGKPAKTLVEEKGLAQMSDTTAVEAVVQQVLGRFQQEVIDYKSGKIKLLGFFVGQIMKETKGKANPTLVNELIKKTLSG
ncbi:MAG: Asp-tRNA(Asn)/Glu-tRNA(Gln) amidotransferase subunit GatB [Pseudomonadota bacterium]